MVRAKSTDRAEARRRYRAATAAAEAEDPALPGQTPAPRTGSSASTSGAKPARLGIGGSFRTAIRPIHLREDLLDLPRIATQTFAIWVPAVIMLGIFVVFEATGAEIGNQSISSVAFNLFIFPPPLAAAFLAGILTQRSSYLAGGVIGLMAGILFAIYVMTANGVSSTGAVVTTDQRVQFATYGLIVSPLAGLAVGGFAGFYRRFLRLANPNAGNRPPAKGSKQAARKR